MRAINHALTGAIIGLTISEPLVAVPVAVASHFVMDAIPHHGDQGSKLKWLRSRLFLNWLYIDALMCATLVLLLVVRQPLHWLAAALCAFAAAAPDLLSINHYQKVVAGKRWRAGLYTTFAGKIQWFERPIGIVVEAAWFIGALIMLAPLLG